jgi:alpha-tubulin suppressor-like RCC1 family protein
MTMPLSPTDINSLGYRWKGIYSSLTSYLENDVVYYNGGAYVIRSGVPTSFALGQQDAILKGFLLKGGVSVGGNWGQVLHSKGSTGVEFRFEQDRNGTIATALMNTDMNGSCYYNQTYMMAIMNEGEVRGWGRHNSGSLGHGYPGDVTTTLPKRVGFPVGTPRITKVKSCWYNTIFLDANGGVWTCGANSLLNGTGVASTVPVKINGKGDLGTNTVVTDIFTAYDYYGYPEMGCIDTAGQVYFWGTNQTGCFGIGNATSQNFPKIVPLSTKVPIKSVFITGNYFGMSGLVDIYGQLWVAGSTSAWTNFNGADSYTHTLFMPWGANNTVKSVKMNDTVYPDAPANYYAAGTIVLDNGSVYMCGDDSGAVYGRWGIPTYAGSGIGYGSALYPYKVLDGAIDCYSTSGGHSRSVALMSDGTVKATGSDESNMFSGTGSVQTWTTIGGSLLTNITKLRLTGGSSSYNVMALRSDGKAVGWGKNTYGACGTGTQADPQSPNTYVALSNKTIIDFQGSGYCNPGSDDNLAYHFLCSDGTVYSTGGGSGQIMDRQDQSRFTPTNVIF